MDPIPTYNLLQAIDPTKIKLPISDRFAKLTLSSNKKKKQLVETEQELQRQQEKRDSVSRDISKEFEEEQKTGQNPLLRSESSKDTHCHDSVSADEEEFIMDALQVSLDYDNPTQLGQDVELLSQQIAAMAVQSRPISLSSGSTCNLSEHSLLVSTESQRSSINAANNIHIVHNIPINVKEALDQENVAINLNPSTNNEFEKSYEMTDDEEEDEAITISDTSESQHEQEQDVMATSSLPSTTLTSENLRLPSLTDDKAERVAAFLRDVSVERRVMLEQGHIDFNDTIDQMLGNKEIDKIQETLAKSHQIASADTESMTPDLDEEVTPTSQLERQKRLKALEESVGNEQNNDNNSEILTESEEEISPNSNDKIKNVHRLANDETQDNTVMSDADVEKTLKVLSNLRTPTNAKIDKNNENNVYRIANDETQCNTEFSMTEDAIDRTPKINSNPKNKTPLNRENSRRLANLETEDNTQLPATENYLCNNNANKETDPHRLVNDDTMANSLISGIDDAQQSLVYNYTQDCKTPEKTGDLTNISSISIHSTPQSLNDSGHKQDSLIIDSSSESNASAPEHSITISETDDESFKDKSPAKSESSDNKKLSNSFQRQDSSDDDSEYDEQMSQIQMSMAKINISAKINIKIHIPNTTSTETSEDDEQSYEKKRKSLASSQSQNAEKESSADDDHSSEANDQSRDTSSAEKTCKQMQLKAQGFDDDNSSNDQSRDSRMAEKTCKQKQLQAQAPLVDVIENSPNKSSDSVEFVEDENFLKQAHKILTQVYGNSWQTPDVMRCSPSGVKNYSNSKTSLLKKNEVKNSKEKKSNHKVMVEESILDDFSIFRRNIVKTNLDSTRLATPKTSKQNKEVSTEPRNLKKSFKKNEKADTKFMPQTERKAFRTPVAKIVTNKGRVNDGRWRQLIDDDSNSEGDNASDDDDADESWSKNATEIEQDNTDSDFESSPRPKARNRKNNSTKRQGRSDKSDILSKKLNKSKEGEIVYLDLSKEEVEVQDEVPESPPANHDVTFASRLQDILKTCRHEDKAKLPSSNKKTKRKLFTPNFGDDDEIALPVEEAIKNKENTTKTINRNIVEEEILDDKGYCPFDSKGRPKALDLVNKQLESVKTGKPIFQLTPSPKKKGSTKKTDKNANTQGGVTPKTKTDNEAKFKTPLTVKSKGPKTLHDLCQTPDYKYNFLKSLDVTVSKTLCHPDALYYRDNYRTKKEDLSKILYDMYNEKLFKNQLNVPITWNKKLSNTAGRCLNKKKLGLRSSAIELSDKVLTSGDRLRCTLIHELCHAATWIFNGEGGHGSTWKEWARRANATFPEIPKIGVCHQYDIEYKYTYKCTLCAAKSHAHSKSKKVENIRCSYCHGAIEVFLNKKDKAGNIIPTPVKEATGFAKFVKDNYKKFKRDDRKHADVMKLLSSEFASLKVATN